MAILPDKTIPAPFPTPSGLEIQGSFSGNELDSGKDFGKIGEQVGGGFTTTRLPPPRPTPIPVFPYLIYSLYP